MTVRTATMMTAFGLMVATTQSASAMPVDAVTPRPVAQRISLQNASPRSLLIHRAVTMLAVGPVWGDGWGVPIIGSARVLSARLERW